MTVPAAARDAGLQPERTRLAWRRTTLACSVAAVLGLRQAMRGPGTPADAVGAGVIVLLWLAFLWVAHLRMRELAAAARPRGLASGAALATVACTVTLAVFAMALLILPALSG
ncbi:DUF202 domain-containing protein [Streptomyces sp. NPDC058701]|uniref:DUF202 domain-containing protein n=1 Tax=Streptomyces sp. NPDC058701 TaxID=3346608 RepID=UPI0036620535